MFVRSLALKTAPEADETAPVTETLLDIARRDAAAAERSDLARRDLARREAAGHAPGFRNLYIMTPDRRLSLRNEAFEMQELETAADPATGAPARWRGLFAVPHQEIDRIDIGPQGTATPAALDHALGSDTLVCFVDGHGATRGSLAPVLAPRAKRHLAQARTVLDPAGKLALARLIVAGRLRNQRALLRKLCRGRDTVPAPVTAAITELTRLIGRGATSRVRHAGDVAQLLGYKGAGARRYWRAIAALVDRDFHFAARDRADPDPANIALNFLSWLLHRDVGVAVLAAGLHPGFGVLHTPGDRHDACVYDLMEEFRAHMIEGLLVYVTNRRILRRDMFHRADRADGGWRLSRAGGDALIRAYEARAAASITWPAGRRRRSFRRMMLSQTHALARYHEARYHDAGAGAGAGHDPGAGAGHDPAESAPYTPFEIDY